MDFVKMHGLGNDFIIFIISKWDEADKFQPYAKHMCDRHFGVGADGLVLIGKDKEMDLFMRIFNPDGSEPEMCGNAIRCVARYAYEYGLVDKTEFTVRTLAGIICPEVILVNDKIDSVRVDMGQPLLSRTDIPMLGNGENIGVEIEVADQLFNITGVSMGNPHCIIFVDDINTVPVNIWGPLLEKNQLFPAGTNVEFVQVISENEIIMRVWERGAGITLACGTGACATLVGAVLNNKSDRKATVHLLGGDLFIEWNKEDNHVYMTGPAVEVFRGCIDNCEL